MADNKLSRELNTREKDVRKKAWVRPETLPNPTPEDGYVYHWVRISTMGQADTGNVSSKLREGWEPVRADAHPEILPDDNSLMRENDPRMPLFNDRKTKVTFGKGN
jgi:hypothetical protein